jgi:[acyl-carrier-protein] S-malonyltransferase
VYWTETVQGLRCAGVSLAVEMGPGKVLAGLGKRIEQDIAVSNVLTPALLEASVATVAACEQGE